MDLIYKIEDIIEGREGLERLGRACWDEVAQIKDFDFEFDPDWANYWKLNEAGMIRYYTIYDGETQVGFGIFLISQSLHCKGKFMGMSDSIYILPEYRSKGAEFINLIQDDLRQEGVTWFSLHIKAWVDTGNLAEKIGCTHYENVLQRRL